MSTDVSGVFISAERLAALEKLEAAHLAAEKKKKEVLAALHAKEKENPKEKSASVLANYYKNKDVINAKRRAQYAAKKVVATSEGKVVLNRQPSTVDLNIIL